MPPVGKKRTSGRGAEARRAGAPPRVSAGKILKPVPLPKGGHLRTGGGAGDEGQALVMHRSGQGLRVPRGHQELCAGGLGLGDLYRGEGSRRQVSSGRARAKAFRMLSAWGVRSVFPALGSQHL